MKNALLAVAVSLAAHCAILGVGAALLSLPRRAMLAPSLAVASVELSLSDEDNVEAADRSSATSPPPSPPRTRPPEELNPSPVREKVPETPPAVSAPAMPSPSADMAEMSAPPSPPAAPVAESDNSASEDAKPARRTARVDAPPRPRKTIRPEYPASSRRRGEQGDVKLEISVDSGGGVESARVVSSSGYRDLDDAALRAVLAAKFVPAKEGRESVAAAALLTLSFRLTK